VAGTGPDDAIDYAIEAEAPLVFPPERPVTETSAVIGDRVAALIRDDRRRRPASAPFPTPSWPGCTAGAG
jgi:hypothetical protein